MRARRAGTPPTQQYRGGGGPAPLATAVSLPTARAARPGAQRRDTPKSAVAVQAVPRPVGGRSAAEELGDRVDDQAGQAAHQRAVDADELQVLADLQLDLARRVLRVPRGDRAGDEL